MKKAIFSLLLATLFCATESFGQFGTSVVTSRYTRAQADAILDAVTGKVSSVEWAATNTQFETELDGLHSQTGLIQGAVQNTGAETIAGSKTFTDPLQINAGTDGTLYFGPLTNRGQIGGSGDGVDFKVVTPGGTYTYLGGYLDRLESSVADYYGSNSILRAAALDNRYLQPADVGSAAYASSNDLKIIRQMGRRMDIISNSAVNPAADFCIIYDDGAITNIMDITSGWDYSFNTPELFLTNCTAYQLNDITHTNGGTFLVVGENFKIDGLGNKITSYIDGTEYYGNQGFALGFSTTAGGGVTSMANNVELEDFNFEWRISGTEDRYVTNDTANLYLGVATWSSNYYIGNNSKFQMTLLNSPVTSNPADEDINKAWTDLALWGRAQIEDTAFVMVASNSTGNLMSLFSLHGHSPDGNLFLKNVNYVSDSITEMWLNEDSGDPNVDTAYYEGCRANMSEPIEEDDSKWLWMSDEEAKGYLFPGTESAWTDGISNRENPAVTDIQALATTNWYPVTFNYWGGSASQQYSANSHTFTRIAYVNNSSAYANPSVPFEAGDTVLFRGHIEFPASSNTNEPNNAIYKLFIRAGWQGGPLTSAGDYIYVTNSTASDLQYDFIAPATFGIADDISTLRVGNTSPIAGLNNTNNTYDIYNFMIGIVK